MQMFSVCQVVEPARIACPLMPTKTLATNQMNVHIECEARGHPQPSVRWLKDGESLPLDSSRLWSVEERASGADNAGFV